MRIVIRARLVRTALGDSLRPFHHECAAWFSAPVFTFVGADIPCWFCFDGVFAIRIIGTTVEDAESSAPLYHFAFAADGTFDPGCWQIAFILFDIFAFWIVGTGHESPEPSISLDKFPVLAIRAGLASFFRPFKFSPINLPRPGAFWEFRT